MDDIQNLAAMAGALATAAFNRGNQETSLKKTLTTAGGFLGINLEAEAKVFLPLFAGLRHRMPVDTPVMGAAQAQWRAQLGFGSFAFGAAANFGTTNDANGGSFTMSATSIAADYKELSLNSSVGWTAIQQAKGFDNAMTLDSMATLSALLRLEELEVLFANEAALSAPASLVMTASTTHAGPVFANGTWNIAVTAITGQGTLTGGAGVTANNVGESAQGTTSVASGASGCDFFDVVIPYVAGAVGYKVYIERTAGGGTYYLCRPGTEVRYAVADTNGAYNTTAGAAMAFPSGQTYVPVTRVQIYAIPPNTQPTSPGASDGSANSNVFEGTLAWCEKSTIYGTSIGTRVVTDMAGLGLTTAGTGIKEFDSILGTQWQTNHTSPSLILCSTNSVTSMSNKVAAAGNNSQIRLDVYGDRNRVVGGIYVGGYVNKFASSMAGMQSTVDVWAHPYMPDGTFLFLSEDIPNQTFPYSRTGKNFALDVQTPYTYFELGRTARAFPYDIFAGETLKCYFPNALSALVGVRVDS